MANISLYGQNYELADLDSEERELFDVQFATLISTSDSTERKILTERADAIVNGIRAIKNALDGTPRFNGLNAGDAELGFGYIRPTHLKSANAQLTVWGTSVTTSFADWLDNGSSAGFAVSANAGHIFTHMKSMNPVKGSEPFLAEMKWKINKVELIALDVRGLSLADNEVGSAVYPIPTMYAMPRDAVYVRIRGDVAGTDFFIPGGFTVAKGKFLNAETATFIT